MKTNEDQQLVSDGPVMAMHDAISAAGDPCNPCQAPAFGLGCEASGPGGSPSPLETTVSPLPWVSIPKVPFVQLRPEQHGLG